MIEELDNKEEKIKKLTNTVNNLRKRKTTLEKNVNELKCALLRVKSDISEKGFQTLNDQVDGLTEEICSLTKKRVQSSNGFYYPTEPYSDNIKKFALTLFSYSKKAYEYVREALNNVLPSVNGIKKWLAKVDGSPGFNKQSFNKLSAFVKEKEMLGDKVGELFNSIF